MEQTEERIDMWAHVELFGHQQLAGRVTTKPMGTTIFFQIDVPDGKNGIAFSRIVNASAIYGMTPISEEMARAYARRRGTPAPVPYLLPMPDRKDPPEDETDAEEREIPF